MTTYPGAIAEVRRTEQSTFIYGDDAVQAFYTAEEANMRNVIPGYILLPYWAISPEAFCLAKCFPD